MKKLLPSTSSSEGGSITLVSRACSRRMDPRGARMTAKSVLLVFAFALTFLFVACGDDDSSSFVEPEKETSSSIAESSSEQGGGDPSSSSVKSSSSEDTKNSSSSAKSSSSTDAKSSSSVTSSSSGTSAGSSAGGNSSSSKARIPCSEEDETATLNGADVICHDGYWVPVSSSSAVPTSSYFDMTEQFNEKVSYGEFTDPRDGQKYRTVSLYDDVFEKTYVFFAENLNYGKMVSGGTVQGDSTKYCYDDDPWYCENGWGGLYTWSNAMGFPAVCDSVSISAEACSQKFVYPSGHIEPEDYVQHQGACPEGWHIMNGGEWAFLSEMSHGDVGYYMGSKVAGFGKENLYGMSLLPAGYWERAPNGSLVFYGLKQQTNFWMAKQYSKDEKMALIVWMGSTGYHRDSPALKANLGYSIRCVKNY